MGCQESETKVRSHPSFEEGWKNSSLREFDGPLSLEERRICKTLPEIQGASCAPGRKRQRRRRYGAVFTVHGASASQRAAATFLDTISVNYMNQTQTCRQFWHAGNKIDRKLGSLQDAPSAGELRDSQSTSGSSLCLFGSHTFVPLSWMCKKHGSAESEIISLDAGLRVGGLPALQ